MEKGRKSQASIIVLVLIVLIVIVAFLIVWNLVNPLIKEKGEEAETTGTLFAINLDVKEVILFFTGVSKISVYRGAGKGDITALKFVFYDENGNTEATEEKTTIPELGTEMYSFSPFSNLGKIKKIVVVPILGKNLGMEVKSEANEIIEIPSGLVSWWRFDDSNDFVGDNHCGSVNIINDEKRGKVASFQNYVSCGNDSSLDMNNEIGISFWIKTNSANGEIIKKGNNYKVSLEKGKIRFSYGKEILSEQIINNNEWHYVVATMMGIYINGIADSSKTMGSSVEINSENLEIGNFNGLLDEVMLFNKGLSNLEVSGLYNNQKI